MKNLFSAEFFSQNRAALRSKLPENAVLVLTAHGLLQRSADTTIPFSQDKNFWYATGLADPDLVLVMTPSKSYIILPEISAVRALFDGAVDATAAQKRSGVDDVLPAKEGWNQLQSDVHKNTPLVTCLPASNYDQEFGYYRNPARRRLATRLRRMFPGMPLGDAREAFARLRAVKQPAEVAALEQAVRITTSTLDHVRRQSVMAQFAYEYELEAAITHGFRRQGARGHAYDPIVAGGKNAATIHYTANEAPLHNGDLLVVDVGAEFEQYAADITRVIAVGKPSQRQLDVLAAVRDVQQLALSLLRPGIFLRDYEREVALAMGKALQDLKLTSNPSDMAVIRRYYPYATSHFLGLDAHDTGFYNEPLAENMVVTCEPGIHIPEENIGVRLEDDILITKNGVRNLSEHCSYDAYVL
ncbi:hypothetical protein CSA80_01175 [Candidatus Saccharibacteria bacterium]|nr:MAG: hypothetical protein CR973_01980 [Candidatus Saccharibacteria bacterium]PID99359.1 MAG: hypothetical protein CSA80_01175 [Candidatus Saccharibacteria bacterium]